MQYTLDAAVYYRRGSKSLFWICAMHLDDPVTLEMKSTKSYLRTQINIYIL